MCENSRMHVRKAETHTQYVRLGMHVCKILIKGTTNFATSENFAISDSVFYVLHLNGHIHVSQLHVASSIQTYKVFDKLQIAKCHCGEISCTF